MTAPTAPDRIEDHDGDVTYIRTDKDLPPVAIIDRSPITTRHKVIFGIIALLGAIAWAVIAFFRGETVNAVWFVIAAICTYVIGFRFDARLIDMKIVRPRDDHATPAEVFENDTDYHPTNRLVLFGHHFAAIAGPGPLIGPVLAAQWGYCPGFTWIVIGACIRRRRARFCHAGGLGAAGRADAAQARPQRSSGPWAGSPPHHRHAVHHRGCWPAWQWSWSRRSSEVRGAMFTILVTIPAALLTGAWMYKIRPGKIGEASVIGVAIVLAGVFLGQPFADRRWAHSGCLQREDPVDHAAAVCDASPRSCRSGC